MSYIITEEENHPDHLIQRILGPFESEDEAYALASYLERHPNNIIPHYRTKRFWYYVTELIDPKDIK